MPWRAEPLVPRARPRLASSTQRGYGTAHRKMRKELLARSPWCVGFPRGVHGKERVRATVMDHRESLRRGGRTEWGNVDPMCARCNGRKAVVVEGARPR